jgi:CO/xanthine dehydrogenase FAD-binding subunit
MYDWDVVQPQTIDGLIHLLDDSVSKIIAGGTDVLPGLRRADANQPVSLIDISRLKGLRFIRECDGQLEIGALTTHAEVIKSEINQKYTPGLVTACSMVGAPQTRARGTLGGNLVNASPAADTAPPLLCLGSTVKLVSQTGERILPLTEFFKGPGKTGMNPDEFLHSVRFNIPSGRWGAGYLKLGRRNGMAIAVASAGVYMALDTTGMIETIRVAFGSVSPVPVRGLRVESVLQGNQPSSELFDRAAAEIDGDISPISDVRATAEYRRNSARVLLVRALEAAWKQAESRMA